MEKKRKEKHVQSYIGIRLGIILNHNHIKVILLREYKSQGWVNNDIIVIIKKNANTKLKIAALNKCQ